MRTERFAIGMYTFRRLLAVALWSLVCGTVARAQVGSNDELFGPGGELRLDAPSLVAWYMPSTLFTADGDGARVLLDLSASGRHGPPAAPVFGVHDGPLTIVCAARVDAADGGYLFDGGTESGRRALFAGWSGAPARFTTYGGSERAGADVRAGQWQVHTVVFDADRTTHYVDGFARSVGPAADMPLEGLTIGARFDGTLPLAGEIAHLVVYRAALGREDRRRVERFVARDSGADLCPPLPHPATDVFVGGDGRYDTYRIPAAAVALDGTVLCFAEGRASRADHAQNDLVMRRSPDGGRSWGPVRTLFSDGENALNNPCVVVLERGEHAGRVLLFWQRYLAGHDEHGAATGYDDPAVCRSYVAWSDDAGRTWSEAREITRAIKPEFATSTASGPGAALQLRDGPHAGRVVLPLNCGPFGAWKVYAAWSDDGGATWQRGDFSDDSQIQGRGNEVQMVELEGGDLLLNARVQGGRRLRVQARSDDGGATWSPLMEVADLIEPQCMASVVARSNGQLVYAGPRSQRARVSGSLFTSGDAGHTWRPSVVVHSAGYAYSQLIELDGGDLGVLFEREDYRAIRFARVRGERLGR